MLLKVRYTSKPLASCNGELLYKIAMRFFPHMLDRTQYFPMLTGVSWTVSTFLCRVRFQERLFAVKAYMRERNLGTFLEQRVINYMGLVWRKYRLATHFLYTGNTQCCVINLYKYQITCKDLHSVMHYEI